MLSQIRPALVLTLGFTLLLGVAYPLAVTGLGRLAFPAQADGSLIRDASGQVIGSALIAQPFTAAGYLHPRPSAAGSDGYDASGSSGSNLGPLNPALAERVKTSADELRGAGPIPADAVTTSGSGLDPDVSPANARSQAARIAAARGRTVAEVETILAAQTKGPALGFLGQSTVNVLKTNLALDAAFGRSTAKPQ
ncbi:MAG: potassium-transporting ATPase subunit C [Caulobacterales bacterium 68-7]|nr:potassium-transporting ATPase subunit KdpC [Caulobacterales bacterium]OJU13349.1 MAG: potassium-transporting ATPase subunit C [Caulobacterales bacterium 68-7]